MSVAGASTHAGRLTGLPFGRPRPTISVSGLKQQLDLVAVMLTVIIAGVTGYVGINIMENTSNTTGLAANDEFFDANANLTSGLESFFSNLGTVFVVIVLVVVIGYLMLLRGR